MNGFIEPDCVEKVCRSVEHAPEVERRFLPRAPQESGFTVGEFVEQNSIRTGSRPRSRPFSTISALLRALALVVCHPDRSSLRSVLNTEFRKTNFPPEADRSLVRAIGADMDTFETMFDREASPFIEQL